MIYILIGPYILIGFFYMVFNALTMIPVVQKTWPDGECVKIILKNRELPCSRLPEFKKYEVEWVDPSLLQKRDD